MRVSTTDYALFHRYMTLTNDRNAAFFTSAVLASFSATEAAIQRFALLR